MIKISILYLALSFFLMHIVFAQKVNQRFIAVTIDDLPMNTRYLADGNQWIEQTEKLLANIKKYNIPAIGFVNENKLYVDNQIDSTRLKALTLWVDAGLDLGNHTFSHSDYHKISDEIFFEDVIRGEKIIKELLASQKKQLKYFRHPYLHTGNTEEKRIALKNFLADHSYLVAPVTIDNGEWIYAFAYEKAFTKNDIEMMRTIGNDYIRYMIDKIKYFENQSIKLFGHEIKQVLLIHSSMLNAEYLDDLAEAISKRNYNFISLDEALTDPAFKSEDNFIGEGGISWLHRWSYTKMVDKKFFEGEPEVPKEIMDYAGIDSE